MNIQKWTALVLGLCLVLSLTACQNERWVEGLVVEVQTDEAGDLTAFVVEDSQGERTGVRLAEKTTVWPMGIDSGTAAEFRAQFQKELQVDALASAWCYPRREKLETAEGEKVRAYWATSVNIDGGLKRAALTLPDGTAVDVLEEGRWGGRTTYRLPDGTELLRVDAPMGPENVSVVGREGFEALSAAAQEKVLDWYETQGLLYDERKELERAYDAYLELGEAFSSGRLEQSVSPSASGERVMYFLTSVTLPQSYGERTAYELQLCAAFDRETGEKIDAWDLFAAPEEEVRRRLPELCGWVDDRALREAMAEVLDPDWMVFFPEYLSVDFPPGSLPGQEYSQIISVNYADVPEGFFQPWAVPVSWNE